MQQAQSSGQLEAFAKQLFNLTEMNEKKLGELRDVVDERLRQILEEMGYGDMVVKKR